MIDGIVIVARLGSSRLPGKQLKLINQIPVIEWLIARIQYYFSDLMIIIATSDRSENQAFDYLEQKYSRVKVFHGHDGNIPLRLLNCARHYQLDQLIYLGGDNPLSSMDGCKQVLTALQSVDPNLDSLYVTTSGLPIGMNVFGSTRKCLEDGLTEEYMTKDDLEFAWNDVLLAPETTMKQTIKMGDYELTDTRIRVTLDYQSDLEFFTKLFEILDRQIIAASDQTIIQTILDHQLNLINNDLTGEYWQNYNQGRKKTFKIV